MPIVFKNDKPDIFTIEKEGTVFYFELDDAIIRRVRMNTNLMREFDPASFMVSLFRYSLFKWENLLDERENEIPFSSAIRDALVIKSDLFNEDDIYNFMDHYKKYFPEPEKKPESDSGGDTETEEPAGDQS